MNKLTNKFFTNVANFVEASGVIANATDKLLSRILSEENVAAWCYTKGGTCGHCFNGKRQCVRCCGPWFRDCRWLWYDC